MIVSPTPWAVAPSLGLLCLPSRMYGIDSTAMIEVARETRRLGERTTFIRGHSHHIELPERVDVVICDHVGCFGFDYGIMHTLQDARQRFLKPGGRWSHWVHHPTHCGGIGDLS